jgi:Pentapeptide repeats (8 copies)
MSWAEYHKQSEFYADEADAALLRGEAEKATRLYCLAAEAEASALELLDPSKIRTLGITAVSATALWHKAGEYQSSKQFAEQWLTHHALPSFAVDQLQELLIESNRNHLNAIVQQIPAHLIPSIPENMNPNQKGILRGKIAQVALESGNFEDFRSFSKEIEQSPQDDFCKLARRIGLDPLKDFAGIDLSRVQLTGADLSGALLTESNLSCADLRNTNLTYAVLERADLSGADLNSSILSGAIFENANLEGTHLVNAVISFANFSGAYMLYADLTGVKFKETRFKGTFFGYNFGISKEMEAYIVNESGILDYFNEDEYHQEEFDGYHQSDSHDLYEDFFGKNN